jgi:hypothetical protein
VRDAGEAGEGAAETVEAEAEVEVAAEAEAELQAVVEEAALEEEEEEEAEEAEAQAEQAVAASLVDTLALVDEQTCAACTPVCGERFSHLTMTTTAKGYAKQWVCIDREACLARQMAGAGERRKVPRRC